MKIRNIVSRIGIARASRSRRRGEQGFTLAETASALLILMIAGMGAASLFAFAIQNNTNTRERELTMAVAQKRLEWLRSIPYSATTRTQAYHYPDAANPVSGGLAQTAATGVVEQDTLAGRSYTVTTIIRNDNNATDAAATSKTITVTVRPNAVREALGSVTLTTKRSILILGDN
jgi:Tfp pilus assembly protein PilV